MPNFTQPNALLQEFEALGIRNPLNAEEFPNDPQSLCWCKSGEIWSKCHKIRQSERRMPFGEILSNTSRAYKKGECMHPEAPTNCSTLAAIDSHTLQRRGALDQIAHRGHVLNFKKGFLQIEKKKGVVEAVPIGVGDASVFPGFCNHHDTTMFRAAEKIDSPINTENCHLISYRALCYEIFTKKAQIESAKIQRKISDRGVPFEDQRTVQNIIYMQMRAATDTLTQIEKFRKKHEDILISKKYHDFQFHAIEFSGAFPLAASGAFFPEYDVNGRQLQNIFDRPSEGPLSLNITILGGKAVVIFGWLAGESTICAQFVESFKRLPDEEKSNYAALLAFEYLENTYFQARWWASISAGQKKILDTAAGNGTVSLREPNSLKLKFRALNLKITNKFDS